MVRIQSQLQNIATKYVFSHKRRINTEEKAKVVAAAWGTELIQFLAALANLHQDDMKKSIYTSSMVFSFKNSMLNL